MIRAAALLVVAAVAALLALQLADDPGELSLRWGSTWIETSALFAVIAAALFFAVLLPGLRFLMAAIDAPGQLKRAALEQKRQRGIEALTTALAAAEAGDFELARKSAARAAESLDEARLAKLAEAHAADAAGDRAAAERAYSSLLNHEDTELLGRRGLLQAALQRGDRIGAMAHADAALRLSRSAAWPFATLFELKLNAGDWDGAVETLDEAEKRRLIGEAEAQRRRAVLLSAAAMHEEREGRPERAADLAERAARLAPALTPAACHAARLLVAEGKAWKAQAVLEEAWEAAPHPALALAYRDIKAEETQGERHKRLMGLVELKPDHRESRYLAAELAMQQGNWQAAWDSLEHVYAERASARVCALFSAICKSRNDEEGARRWQAQAVLAPRESAWSDLDPEQAPFRYDEQSWARLVFAFGDEGMLIHPRLERGSRDVGGGVLALPPILKGAPASDRAAWASTVRADAA